MFKRTHLALLTAICWLILTGTVYAIPLPPTGTLNLSDGILIGSAHEDWVGSGGIQRLPSGNVLVLSPDWNGGRGAVTCLTPAELIATGTPIQVNVSNSLVGSQSGDRVGEKIVLLGDGSYVVKSPLWDNGALVDAGAATWIDGNTCFPHGASSRGAVISAANSLVGTHANDQVGATVNVLSSGNLHTYIVIASGWDSDTTPNVGAVTVVSSPDKRAGIISATNSLVGSTTDDTVNLWYSVKTGGKIFLGYPLWDDSVSTAIDVGALLWMPINAPKIGTISASNALIGSSAYDHVSFGIVNAADDSNYIITTPDWDNGATADVGAITWFNGQTGLVGKIDASNSMLGSTTNDKLGNGQFLTLPNGKYVVSSPNWDNGALVDAGAVYMGDGSKKVTGSLSAANALVGDHAGDQLRILFAGEGSSFFVHATEWNTRAGALRAFNGKQPVVGTINAANSLVGATPHDWLGSSGIIKLSNGHFVVGTPYFDNGGATDVGAATWFNKNGSTVGTISPANSLIGTATNDLVSHSLFALTNDNYVIGSRYWDNGSVVDAGAVTWGNGSGPTSAIVSTANSVVGSSTDDRIGKFIRTTSNGNYLAASDVWDNGSAVDAGAVMWLTGSAPTSAVVSPANSIVGTTSGDTIGIYLSTLPNGHYLAASPNWDNGSVVNAGAVTWIDSTKPTIGTVSNANSTVGRSNHDQVGNHALLTLANGNYVIPTYSWDSDTLVDVGAVTWCNGSETCAGIVSTTNSLVGAESGYLPFTRFIAYPNGDYMIHIFTSLNLYFATTTLIYGDGTRPLTGVVGSEIGLVGALTTTVMPDYSLIIGNFLWKNEANHEVGIIARIDGPQNRLQNGGYEIKGSKAKFASNWNLNLGATGADKRLCDKPVKPLVRTEGNCLFQFSSTKTPPKARTLKQIINAPTWAEVGDTLTLSADVEGLKVGAGAKKVILNVIFTNGLRERATLTIPTGTYDFTTLVGTVKLPFTVRKIVVTVNVGKAKGRIRVDNLFLRDSAAGRLAFPLLSENTTRDGVETFGLPDAPDAPEGFRN